MQAIRAFAFNCAFVLVTVVLGIAGFWVRGFARHRALGLARIWVRATVACLRVIAGIRVEVIGRENLPPGAAVVASQHRSAFDTLVWLTLVERPSYVMKQELRRLPLVGGLLVPAGMIPVDRAAGAAALRAMRRDADAALAAGRQVVIFPEGTRVAPGASARLNPGVVALAGRPGSVLVPVATDSGLAWGRGSLLRVRGAEATRRVIHVAIGAPLALAGTGGGSDAATGRATLIPAIEAAWREGEARIAACGQVCA